MQSVRPDAPWCPSNIEFIRRINGLDSIEDVQRIVFDASYLVMGLGDVYLGAPVATPLDPRHRLVTTKYNPARTWTAENSVGIGGAYLCVYGMEGPGGYQFVGRTVQMWNTVARLTPWLLRFFDQIRFYPVEADELLDMRDRFAHGKFDLEITRAGVPAAGLPRVSSTVSAKKPASSKPASRRLSKQSGNAGARRSSIEIVEAPDEPAAVTERTVPAGCRVLKSPAHASVWHIAVKAGDRVEAGQRLVVVESMKMEIAVAAPQRGIVVEVLCRQGEQVTAGQSTRFPAS